MGILNVDGFVLVISLIGFMTIVMGVITCVVVKEKDGEKKRVVITKGLGEATQVIEMESGEEMLIEIAAKDVRVRRKKGKWEVRIR